MKYDWKDKIILVAEDEYTNYLLLAEILSETNASLIWAKNGLQAVEFFLNNSIDVVLMDIKMPGMNGYEATKKIRELNKKVPVIAQTAFAMAGEKEKIMESGCDDYIAKPIKYDQILSLISKYMSC